MDAIFADRLKEARIAKGLTQKELAAKAEVASASYSAYEKGKNFPPLDSALRLAKVLGVSLDWLCGLTAIQYRTYADGFQGFLNCDASKLRIVVSTDEIPLEEDKAYTEDEIREAKEQFDLNREFESSTAPGPMSRRAILYISDDVYWQLFEKWHAIREQNLNGYIDEELYTLWSEKQLSETRKIPMPFWSEPILEDESVTDD